jgi:hypothetical protein
MHPRTPPAAPGGATRMLPWLVGALILVAIALAAMSIVNR